jgi:hypothetical protein
MGLLKTTLTVAGIAFLTACGGTWQTSYEAPIDAAVSRGWSVGSVNVVVPDDLTTTEANIYAPDADIVWHGDEFGDRKAQVAAVMKDGITAGASGLRGGTSVAINVTLREFHALTPRARNNAPSAVHNISYTIQIVDIRTGIGLTEPELIRADLPAYTGATAIEAVIRGDTQKVRIARHLSKVTAGWLGIGPDPRQQFSGAGR